MKITLLAFVMILSSFSSRAETVRLTESSFADKRVAIIANPLLATHRVYFTKTSLGADCGIYVSNSLLSERVVKVVKNPIWADLTVARVGNPIAADTLVYVAKTPMGAFGKCEFAAALLVPAKR